VMEGLDEKLVIGDQRGVSWTGLSNDIVSVSVPYMCIFCKICCA
jgi:hypothetical protein